MATSAQSSRKFEVFFAPRSFLTATFDTSVIVIAPSTDNWNDFGIRSLVDIRILDQEGHDYTTAAYIGFLAEGPSDARRLDEILARAPGAPVPAKDTIPFFTMLSSMDAYRRLVENLTVPVAQAALLAARDVVATAEFRPNERWLNAATKSEVFVLSFVRDSEAYFAFKNASTVLHGLAQESLQAMSPTIRS